MARRRTLWVPALLSALAVLIVLGGVAVGQFYWSNLHSTIWHAEASIGRARQSQNALLRNTQELLGAEQQRLKAQANALAEARKQLKAERAALAREREALRRQAAALRAQDAAHLQEAQTLVGKAQQHLGNGKPSAADAALAAARELIAGSTAADALAEHLDQARRRLNAATPAYRGALATRISEVQGQAANLKGRPRQRIGYYGQPWPPDPRDSATAALVAQLARARFAVERGDAGLYRQAVAAAKLWLAAISGVDEKYKEKLTRGIASLESAGLDPDYGPVTQDLSQLQEALHRAADELTGPASPEVPTLTDTATCGPPGGGT
jgi:hypothetical protein